MPVPKINIEDQEDLKTRLPKALCHHFSLETEL